MIYPLLPPETNGRYPVVLVYAISMTALFLFIVVILLLQQRRKSRLNWFVISQLCWKTFSWD